jgi:hypothetical protein
MFFAKKRCCQITLFWQHNAAGGADGMGYDITFVIHCCQDNMNIKLVGADLGGA